MTVTADRLAAKALGRLRGGVGGADWDESAHPRDRRGRFIETGAEVRVWGGSTGRVTRNLGRGRIEIEVTGGRRQVVHRNYLTVVARPDGSEPTSDREARPADMPEQAPDPDADDTDRTARNEVTDNTQGGSRARALEVATDDVLVSLRARDEHDVATRVQAALNRLVAALRGGDDEEEADARADYLDALDDAADALDGPMDREAVGRARATEGVEPRAATVADDPDSADLPTLRAERDRLWQEVRADEAAQRERRPAFLVGTGEEYAPTREESDRANDLSVIATAIGERTFPDDPAKARALGRALAHPDVDIPTLAGPDGPARATAYDRARGPLGPDRQALDEYLATVRGGQPADAVPPPPPDTPTANDAARWRADSTGRRSTTVRQVQPGDVVYTHGAGTQASPVELANSRSVSRTSGTGARRERTVARVERGDDGRYTVHFTDGTSTGPEGGNNTDVRETAGMRVYAPGPRVAAARGGEAPTPAASSVDAARARLRERADATPATMGPGGATTGAGLRALALAPDLQVSPDGTFAYRPSSRTLVHIDTGTYFPQPEPGVDIDTVFARLAEQDIPWADTDAVAALSREPGGRDRLRDAARAAVAPAEPDQPAPPEPDTPTAPGPPANGTAEDIALRRPERSTFQTLRDIEPGDLVFMFGGVAGERWQRDPANHGTWLEYLRDENETNDFGRTYTVRVFRRPDGTENRVVKDSSKHLVAKPQRAATPEPDTPTPPARRGRAAGGDRAAAAARREALRERLRNPDAALLGRTAGTDQEADRREHLASVADLPDNRLHVTEHGLVAFKPDGGQWSLAATGQMLTIPMIGLANNRGAAVRLAEYLDSNVKDRDGQPFDWSSTTLLADLKARAALPEGILVGARGPSIGDALARWHADSDRAAGLTESPAITHAETLAGYQRSAEERAERVRPLIEGGYQQRSHANNVAVGDDVVVTDGQGVEKRRGRVANISRSVSLTAGDRLHLDDGTTVHFRDGTTGRDVLNQQVFTRPPEGGRTLPPLTGSQDGTQVDTLGRRYVFDANGRLREVADPETGRSLNNEGAFNPAVNAAMDAGIVEWADDNWRLTEDARRALAGGGGAEPTPPEPDEPRDATAPDVDWGAPYGGDGPAYTTPDGPVWMRRGPRGRVRFYNADGEQVGPEQANVAPAAAYALNQGWSSVMGPPMRLPEDAAVGSARARLRARAAATPATMGPAGATTANGLRTLADAPDLQVSGDGTFAYQPETRTLVHIDTGTYFPQPEPGVDIADVFARLSEQDIPWEDADAVTALSREPGGRDRLRDAARAAVAPSEPDQPPVTEGPQYEPSADRNQFTHRGDDGLTATLTRVTDPGVTGPAAAAVGILGRRPFDWTVVGPDGRQRDGGRADSVGQAQQAANEALERLRSTPPPEAAADLTDYDAAFAALVAEGVPERVANGHVADAVAFIGGGQEHNSESLRRTVEAARAELGDLGGPTADALRAWLYDTAPGVIEGMRQREAQEARVLYGGMSDRALAAVNDFGREENDPRTDAAREVLSQVRFDRGMDDDGNPRPGGALGLDGTPVRAEDARDLAGQRVHWNAASPGAYGGRGSEQANGVLGFDADGDPYIARGDGQREYLPEGTMVAPGGGDDFALGDYIDRYHGGNIEGEDLTDGEVRQLLDMAAAQVRDTMPRGDERPSRAFADARAAYRNVLDEYERRGLDDAGPGDDQGGLFEGTGEGIPDQPTPPPVRPVAPGSRGEVVETPVIGRVYDVYLGDRYVGTGAFEGNGSDDMGSDARLIRRLNGGGTFAAGRAFTLHRPAAQGQPERPETPEVVSDTPPADLADDALDGEIGDLSGRLRTMYGAGTRPGDTGYDTVSGRRDALLAERERRDTAALAFDVNDVLAVNLTAGSTVVLDIGGRRRPYEVTSVDTAGGGDVRVEVRGADGVTQVVDIPRANPVPVAVGAGSDDLDVDPGDTLNDEDTGDGQVRVANLRPGTRVLPGNGSVATVVAIEPSPDVEEWRDVTLRYDDGTTETVPFGGEALLAIAPAPVQVSVEPLEAGTATARPVLYTYQRRNLVALDLDADPGQPDAVRQAAARVRARQPLSEEQAAALRDALYARARDGGLRPVQQRATLRLAWRMDAAAAQARGDAPPPLPAELANRRVTATSPSEIGVGDTVALHNGPRPATVGKVASTRTMMRGRLIEVVVETPDGQQETRLMTRDTTAYVLPDLPDPKPVVPTGDDGRVDERVAVADLRPGDVVLYRRRHAQEGLPDTVEATVVSTAADEDGGAMVTLDTPYGGRYSSDPDAPAVLDGARGVQIIRIRRGEGSADQPPAPIAQRIVEETRLTDAADVTVGTYIRHRDATRTVEVVGWVTDVTVGDDGELRMNVWEEGADRVQSLRVYPEDGGGFGDLVRLAPSDGGVAAAIAARRARRELEREASYLALSLARPRNAAVEVAALVPPGGALSNPAAAYVRAAQEYRTDRRIDGWANDIAGRLTPGVRGGGAGGGDAVKAALMERSRALAIEAYDRTMEAVAESIRQTVPAPGETNTAAVARVIAALREEPPEPFDLMEAGIGLARLKRATFGERDTVDLSGTEDVVPALPTGGTLAERVQGYRAALGGRFGYSRKTITSFGDVTLDDLVAGRLPDPQTADVDIPDRAADGGPGETAMRQLDVVIAAGADLQAAMNRKINAGLGIAGDTPPEEHVAGLRAEVDALGDPFNGPAARAYRDAQDRAAAEVVDPETGLTVAQINTQWNAALAQSDTAAMDRLMPARRRAEEAATTWPPLVEARAARAATADRRKALRDEIAGFERRFRTLRRQAALETLRESGIEIGGRRLTYMPTDRYDLVKSHHALGEGTATVKAMRFAEDSYPTAWLDALISRRGQTMGLRTKARAWYVDQRNAIALSKDIERVDGAGAYGEVAVHELGHAMERAVQGLVAAEDAFLWRRTSTGEVGSRTREPLTLIYKPKKDKEEVGRKDRFKNHYTGKEYGDRGGDRAAGGATAFELFQTAVQDLLGGGDYTDSETQQWTLGVLALLRDPAVPRRT